MKIFKKTQLTTIILKDQAAQKTNSPAPQVSALRWKGGMSQEESKDSKIPFIANPKVLEITGQVRPES